MKKVLFGSTLLLTTLLFSCKKENASIENQVTDQQTLNFTSNKEMESKINSIAALQNNHEAEIAKKILSRNKLMSPFKNTNGDINTIDKNAVLNDLKFYHTERLNAIYQLRSELHFTSLQSIADEINSLTLLNPVKADALYNNYSSLLKRSEFGVSTIYDDRLATVINVNGQVLLNGKNIAPDRSNASARLINTVVTQGFVANNGLFAITYAAGVENHADDIGNAFQKRFTQLAGYINTGGGFVLYPTWFYTNEGSGANFTTVSQTGGIPFPVGANTVIRNESDITVTSIAGSWTLNYGVVAGTFVTVVNGQYISIAGAVTF